MNYKGLYDTRAENLIIGSIMNKPDLVLEEMFPLRASDFHSKRNKILFGVLFNLAHEGVEIVTPQDVDSYLMRYQEQYRTFTNTDGIRALITVTEAAEHLDKVLYKSNYARLKKFSILRGLVDAGFDTKQFYDPDDLFSSKNSDFEGRTVEDILNVVKAQINEIEEQYATKSMITDQDASEGLDDLLVRLKENPEIGEEMEGDIYNAVVKGSRYGKFYLNSAPSGHGKTRQMVGHACKISYPRLDKDGSVIYRETGYKKSLYVATEQEADEIQTLILAYISGVDEEKIIEGRMSVSEEEMVHKAKDIMIAYRGNFIIEYIPNPSIGLVKSKLLKHIYKNGITHIFYDYIFSSPGLLGEFRDLKIREDVVLMMLSNSLKEIAVEHGVFIMSATQLNGKWETDMVRNANHIRGSKAVVDKIDVGSISIRIPDEEMESILELIETLGLKNNPPNMVVDVYKNRRGKLNAVKLFRRYDYGTCRAEDLFLTDTRYNVIENYTKMISETIKKDLLELLTERSAENEQSN